MAIEVKFASRYYRRKAATAVGKSALKSLTEPITNSDDSYRRLEEKGETSDGKPKPIYIVWEKKTRTFHIVDNAEGLTTSDMVEKFGEYGKDSSGASEGYRVRGLFGQGISDVLFHHDRGCIESIVDKVLYRCRFRENKAGRWEIDPKKTDAKVTLELRKHFRIPKGNGTFVSFQLAAGTKKPRKFVEALQNFYMLRFIMSDPNREVYYIESIGGHDRKRQKLDYSFPNGHPLVAREESMSFEDYPPIIIKIKLFKSEDSLLETDANGFLVFDEQNTVYDRTFFGFELNHPGAEKLFGTVQLNGASHVILDKINLEKPEEILTDERDGFHTTHDFYKQLEAIIKPIIEPFILANRRMTKEEETPAEYNKNQRRALDLFDQLYKDVIEDTTLIWDPRKSKVPPENGMEFDRKSINATENKSYGIGLNVNTAQIPVGSLIHLSSDNLEIAITPATLEVTEDMIISENLARRHVSIRGSQVGLAGQVVAAWSEKEASVEINIVKQNLEYPDTLCFDPARKRVGPEGEGRINLFVNTIAIPHESVIELTADYDQIVLDNQTVEVREKDLVADGLVCIKIKFLTGDLGVGYIRAKYDDFEAQATITIVEPGPDQPTAPQTRFKGWQFIEDGLWQCFYDSDESSPTRGYLLVSKKHKLNKVHFGDDPTKESVSRSLLAQIYLADILLDSALDYLFHEFWKQERDSGGNPSANRDPHLFIRQYLNTEKERIGPQFCGLFVDQEMLRAFQSQQ